MNCAILIPQRVKCNQYTGKTLLLTCTVNYPLVLTPFDNDVGARISALYRSQANAQLARCQGDLKQDALEDEQSRRDEAYPFIPYEALTTYQVTLNQHCLLSLYFDAYTFTGGAHGGTVRTSDTWSLLTGKRLTLGDLFPGNDSYEQDIVSYIQNEVGRQIEGGEGLYFDDSPALVKSTFDPDHFFLTPDGVTIYFQQYDIAPYASGILTFLIPWGELGATMPPCP